MPSQFIGDLVRKRVSCVKHCKQNPFYFKRGIERAFYKIKGPEKHAYSFKGEIFTLNRDEQAVSGNKGVESQKTEGRGAVYKDIVILALNSIKGAFKNCFPAVF